MWSRPMAKYRKPQSVPSGREEKVPENGKSLWRPSNIQEGPRHFLTEHQELCGRPWLSVLKDGSGQMPTVNAASLGECIQGGKSRAAGGKVEARQSYPFHSYPSHRVVCKINWDLKAVCPANDLMKESSWLRALCQLRKTEVFGITSESDWCL